jgi:outer membrane protein assembly factor BamD
LLKNILNTLKLGGKALFLHFEIISNDCFLQKMRKNIALLLGICCLFILVSCAGEFNRVYKTTDYAYKYEYAKECFAKGKYAQSISLLQELVTILKGTDNGEECLYMLAMSHYANADYESASDAFKKYYSTYPKGLYAEQASFYIGQSLYQSTPEPRLDQTPTISAINAFQQFLDFFPDSDMRIKAQDKLFELQDKLVMKEYLSAKLYYDLGDYFGNCNFGGSNFEACIVTSQNALKNYPYTKMREDFALLIMKSKFELAEQSVESRKLERFRDAEDECYGFLNEYPDSKNKSLAEQFINKCKKITKN